MARSAPAVADTAPPEPTATDLAIAEIGARREALNQAGFRSGSLDEAQIAWLAKLEAILSPPVDL